MTALRNIRDRVEIMANRILVLPSTFVVSRSHVYFGYLLVVPYTLTGILSV